MSDFQTTLDTLRKQINIEIESYFQRILKDLPEEDVFVRDAIKQTQEIVLAGGKRLRGALLYYGYIASGATEREAALRAAVGIELIHAYLLVHDDIMDRDDKRHGVSTLHVRYADFATKHFPEKDSVHFGNAIALVLGDMLCAYGNDCIYEVDLPRDQVGKAIRKMQAVVHHTGVGQIQDMYIEFLGEATEEEILTMYKNKTARYTFEGPLHIGLFLGGGSGELEEVFTKYALPLGIAFQLQDDLLGLFGDEHKTGKAVGADIRRGKVTLLAFITSKLLGEKDRARFQELCAKKEDLTQEDIREVQALVEASGARREVEGKIKTYIDQALALLADAEEIIPAEAIDFLYGIAHYMSERKM